MLNNIRQKIMPTFSNCSLSSPIFLYYENSDLLTRNKPKFYFYNCLELFYKQVNLYIFYEKFKKDYFKFS